MARFFEKKGDERTGDLSGAKQLPNQYFDANWAPIVENVE